MHSFLIFIAVVFGYNVATGAGVICPPDDVGTPTYFRRPSNCSQFYECTHGIPRLFNCSAGLVFNTKLNVCDNPANVDCNQVPVTTDTEPPVTNSTSTPPVTNSTSTPHVTNSTSPPPVTNLTSSPTPISPVTNSTSTPSATNSTTPSVTNSTSPPPVTNSTFQPPVTNSTSPSPVPVTNSTVTDSTTPSVTNSTSPPPVTNSTSTPNTDAPSINCPAVDGVRPTYFRNPEDCSQFYECSNGVPYLIDCPTGLVFNTELDVCDWPWNVNCTNENPTTVPSVTNTTSANTTLPVSTTTPSANVTTGIPSTTDGNSTTVQTTTEAGNTTSSSIAPTTSVYNVCKDSPDGFFLYPYPDDCGLYVSCDHGRATVMPCPVGLHFNPKIHVCTDPESAGCENNEVYT